MKRKSDFEQLLECLSGCDDKKVIDGCFENYPRMQFTDPMLHKVSIEVRCVLK